MRLRHFACLSKGDIIAINYNNKIYELNVLETKPAAAVSIIECDMNVDFEAPPGYVEPRVQREVPMERRSPSLTSARCCPNRQDLWHLPDLEIDWMARKGEPIVRLKFRRDSSRSTQEAFLITISN